MSKLIRWFMIATLAIAFTACGGGGGDNPTAQEIAQAKIVSYADSNGTNGDAPTVEDYIAAGVTGVTEANLGAMNELVENSTVDSLTDVQALADSLGVPVNTAPSITSSADTTATEDTAYSYSATATDVESDTITWSISGEPAGMTMNSSTGAISWTPLEGVTTSEEVTITATDDGTPAMTDTQKFTITVTAVNDAPTATADTKTVDEDSVNNAITLAGTDPEGSSLTYTIISNPSNGTLSGTAPDVTYTPTADYAGADSFTFRVNDGDLNSTDATVSITVTAVNDAPTATADTKTVDEDSVNNAITLAGTDPEGSSLTYTIISNPSNGTLSGTAPDITYTPTADYAGAGSFTFRVNDGDLNSMDATVSVTVTAVNDAPVAVADSNTTVKG